MMTILSLSFIYCRAPSSQAFPVEAFKYFFMNLQINRCEKTLFRQHRGWHLLNDPERDTSVTQCLKTDISQILSFQMLQNLLCSVAIPGTRLQTILAHHFFFQDSSKGLYI